LGGSKHKARALGFALAFGVMLAIPALAQLELGQNVGMTLSGDIGYGYSAAYGSQENSSHGTGVNGDGVLQGYYYNPKFLNFFVDPIYNRSQANSGQGSITDATSVNAGLNLFSGSHFPGSISFGEGFNSSGNYGLGVTPGLATTSNSHNFGIGWAELIPGLPPLSVHYSQSASSSSIFGTDQEDHSGSKNFNMNSSYKLDGWLMGARFTDTWTHVDLPSVITGNEGVNGDTNSKEFSVNTNHKLPLRGGFAASYGWSEFSGTNEGTTITGSNQVLNASASFAPTQRFTTQFQVNYNTNLAGEIEQQLVGAGAVNPAVNLGTSSYSISMSNYDNVALTKALSVGFSVGHTQQEVYGETVSATHFSAVANYRFLKPLWGTLVVYAGVNDQATDGGNQGAGLVAGANFNKRWSNTEISGSFGYAQDVQTILATQVTSSYSYTALAQRRLGRRGLTWMGTFNGFHTGLGESTGESAHSESYGTNLGYKMYNMGASYSRSSGTVLLTANGLVTPPGGIAPILPGNQYLMNDGSSYSFNFTSNPVRKLVVSTAYTKTINDGSATALAPGTYSNSKVFLVFTEYQFRKLMFSAGYTNLNQFVSASGLPRASYSNFYVGIQRWFRAF